MRQRGGKGQRTDDRPDVRDGFGPAVELRGVRRQYGRGPGAVHALAGVDLALQRGS
ncbi:ABC transporter ATP-binding protein, partial [Streptomyces sp. NPDC050421]